MYSSVSCWCSCLLTGFSWDFYLPGSSLFFFVVPGAEDRTDISFILLTGWEYRWVSYCRRGLKKLSD